MRTWPLGRLALLAALCTSAVVQQAPAALRVGPQRQRPELVKVKAGLIVLAAVPAHAAVLAIQDVECVIDEGVPVTEAATGRQRHAAGGIGRVGLRRMVLRRGRVRGGDGS